MKNCISKIQILGAFSVLAFSCEPKIDSPEPTTAGAIDVTKYISIGNSITAGYADNGLYLSGQKVGYPLLIAEQFKLVGGGEFNAPLFDQTQADGTGYLKLAGFNIDGTPNLVSVPGSLAAIKGISADAYDSKINPDSIVLQPYTGAANHNFGVPGIRIKDINTTGYGVKNPYFGRMLTDAEKVSVNYASKVVEEQPTFFTCWLGNNDVLGYSTAGGYVDLGSVTAATEFNTNYTQLINRLMSKPKTKGALANIPDVTSIPFFTTVGPPIKAKLKAANVKGFYEFKFDTLFANKALTAPVILDTNNTKQLVTNLVSDIASTGVTGSMDGKVFFTLTFSPYASKIGQPSGKAWADLIRNLIELYGLPKLLGAPAAVVETLVWAKSGLDTTKPFGLHKQNPIPDIYVLDANESGRAKAAVNSYNKIIKGIATSKGLAYVDANSFLSNVTKGAYYDAISTKASFISGGVFSLDGVHLTPRGNALAANEFIKAINGTYKTVIPVVNPGKYPGVRFP